MAHDSVVWTLLLHILLVSRTRAGNENRAGRQEGGLVEPTEDLAQLTGTTMIPPDISTNSDVQSAVNTSNAPAVGTSENVPPPVSTDNPVIFGGAGATSRTDYPWMARIGCYTQDNLASDIGNCAGALISTTHVLTAAHCLYVPIDFARARSSRRAGKGYVTVSRSKATYCKVTLGDLTAGTTEGTEVDRFVRDGNIYPHESYNPSATVRSNDIGMLKIDAVTLGVNVGVITLAATVPPSDTSMKILGWGLKSDGTRSNTLQVADAVVRSTDYCTASWNCASQSARFNSAQQTCYGGDGKVVVCTGDGGGPAVYASTLVAVHSFSRLSASSAFGACSKFGKASGLWYRLMGLLLNTGNRNGRGAAGGSGRQPGGRQGMYAADDFGGGANFLVGTAAAIAEARGISNAGSVVCDANVPSVGTSVPAFSAWITQTKLKLV